MALPTGGCESVAENVAQQVTGLIHAGKRVHVLDAVAPAGWSEGDGVTAALAGARLP